MSRRRETRATPSRGLNEPEQLPDPRCRVRTQSALALLFDVSLPTVATWIDRGLPRRGDGSFWLPDCIRWFVDRRVKQAGRRGSSGPPELREWQARNQKASALTKEQRLARLQEDHYSLSDVQALLTQRVAHLSPGLAALPLLARELHGLSEHEIARRLDGRVEDLIQAWGQHRADEVLRAWARIRRPRAARRRTRAKARSKNSPRGGGSSTPSAPAAAGLASSPSTQQGGTA